MKTIFLNILFYFIAFFYLNEVKAQELTSPFILSSVGPILNMSNNSMALTFNSNATCLNMQNGTAVFVGNRGLGLFAFNCDVNTKYNTLGIKLFPNPVAANTKIKFINIPPLEEVFAISIWNAEGFKLSSSKATGYELCQGKLIDFSVISMGAFVIQIESAMYKDALKFIKAK